MDNERRFSAASNAEHPFQDMVEFLLGWFPGVKRILPKNWKD